MPRLFLSHSSKDNVAALALQRWLVAQGWSSADVFIDLHGIGAGERWRDTLRKANASCEAVLLLASPDSLDSKECQREINLAEDLGKQLIVALLRDLVADDPRLSRWSDTQFVKLAAEPRELVDSFEHEGKQHSVAFNLPALLSIKARLEHLGIAPESFAWNPTKEGQGPYPGLAAFDEDDAGIFFGREADLMAGLTKLRRMRRSRSPRLLVIQAASGAGKSSFLRAGLWPRLKRDPDFAPLALLRPALGVLTGPDGVGRRIAPFFERYGTTKVPGEINAQLSKPNHEAAIALSALIAEATALATTARRAANPDALPPAPLIAIDQGEELFAAENTAESERFLELLAAVIKDPPPGVDPYVLITIRADSVGTLLQRWPALGLEAPEAIYLPPLAPSSYRDVIVRPAQVYSDRVRRLSIEPGLVEQLARDAQGADALPLLAFTLEKLFHEFGTDGKLTLERYEAAGGAGGSIDRALTQARQKAGTAGRLEDLKRLMVPGLATWDMRANAAKRLPAREAQMLSGDRAGLAPLAQALVDSRLLTRGAGTLEVAHEALLRRPPIDGWLEAQKDELRLRDNVLKEAEDWEGKGAYARVRHPEGLVRRGDRLRRALALQANKDFTTALAPAVDYLTACLRLETAANRRARRTQAAIFTMMALVIAGLLARMNEQQLRYGLDWATTFYGYAKKIADLGTLKPGEAFAECADTFSSDRQDGQKIHTSCPDMVVMPAGSFVMGDDGMNKAQHNVTIAKPFAASKYAVTFDQWDACVAGGGCEGYVPSQSGWGRGTRPVINVSWQDSQRYVDWLNKMTGTKAYRLLTEAEFEYAARAGTTTNYPWGDEIGIGNANCKGCGSQWGNQQTAPVGSFAPNAFGLYDMHGNVWQWVQDGWHYEYDANSPADGTERTIDADTGERVVRGGGWVLDPVNVRSSYRDRAQADLRENFFGFRVARTLTVATPGAH